MKSRTPKVLLRICGREMLSLVVDVVMDASFAPVVVVPPDSGAFRDALGDRVRYVEQAQPLGSGHAVLQTAQLLRGVDDVAVLHADVPLIRPETLTRMMEHHVQRGACITMLTSRSMPSDGLGRVLRDPAGAVAAVVEEQDADDAVRAITEVNAGIYCFRTSWLWESLKGLVPSASGEFYLTSLVSLAVKQGQPVETIESLDPHETAGVNTRVQLAQVDGALRQRIREKWMLQGVSMQDPLTVYIDATVELGSDTVVLANTHLTGNTRIGSDCEIGPNSMISDSTLGDRCRVVASMVNGAKLAEGVHVGPFSHVRPGSCLEDGVFIGSFAEVKMSRLGPGTKSHHFSYVGDADLGANVNVGAGTVTCNYDGKTKHRTIVGDDAFIGSGSMLIAPVTIGARSTTGAGSVVTKDVPPDSLVVGSPARVRSKKKPG